MTEYKLVVVGGDGTMTWQPGANRKLSLSEEDCSNGSVLVYVPWEQEEGGVGTEEGEGSEEKERGGVESSSVAAVEAEGVRAGGESGSAGRAPNDPASVKKKKKIPQTANLLLVSRLELPSELPSRPLRVSKCTDEPVEKLERVKHGPRHWSLTKTKPSPGPSWSWLGESRHGVLPWRLTSALFHVDLWLGGRQFLWPGSLPGLSWSRHRELHGRVVESGCGECGVVERAPDALGHPPAVHTWDAPLVSLVTPPHKPPRESPRQLPLLSRL